MGSQSWITLVSTLIAGLAVLLAYRKGKSERALNHDQQVKTCIETLKELAEARYDNPLHEAHRLAAETHLRKKLRIPLSGARRWTAMAMSGAFVAALGVVYVFARDLLGTPFAEMTHTETVVYEVAIFVFRTFVLAYVYAMLRLLMFAAFREPFRVPANNDELVTAIRDQPNRIVVRV